MVYKTLSIPRLGVISSIAIIFLGTFIPTKTESAAPVTAGSTSNGVVTVGGLISQLAQHDPMRAISLLEYSANRRYQVTNEKGKLRSEAQVSLQYQSPDNKEFKIVSESGPAMLRNIVKSLLTFETEAALGTLDNAGKLHVPTSRKRSCGWLQVFCRSGKSQTERQIAV